MQNDNIFPVGAILTFAGNEIETTNNIWLPCDGRKLKKKDFPELYDILGDTYDAGTLPEEEFQLPDYRGYFLRGSDEPKNIGTEETYTTKLPAKPFLGNVAHLPTGNLGISGETRSNASKKEGNYDGPTCTDGGDKESRPRNVYVNYYIKTRNK